MEVAFFLCSAFAAKLRSSLRQKKSQFNLSPKRPYEAVDFSFYLLLFNLLTVAPIIT